MSSDQTPESGRTADVRTVLVSSVIGTTVEWYDFFLYSTAAGLVFDELFFPSDDPYIGTMLAFVTFFVGFVARPLGGVLFGHIGDRIGRKRTLVSTMVLMGLATAAMGLLPTYQQVGMLAPALLVLLRLLQGLAIGGEWAGAVLMAVEYAPPGRRARYGAWPQVGLALGLGLGTGLFALLGNSLDEQQFLDYGWRIAFGLSIVLVFVGLAIRLRVSETPAFRRMRALEGAARVPILELFREPVRRRNTLLGLLSRWAEGAAFNTWAVFFISYSTSTLGMARNDVLVAIMAASITLAVLIPVFGAVADRWTPRRTYALGAAVYGVLVYPAFLAFQSRDPLLAGLVVVLLLGVVHAVIYAPQGTFYAQLTPVRLRYTGMSFVYQFSGIYASGLTPLIVTALLAAGGGSPWLACGYLLLTGVIGAVAALAIRERDLFATAETAPDATSRESVHA
ncbi:MFS transporter [Saccharopolyspora erythraea]|uniref:Metabolite transporter, MFS superfamily n=1 Tax=Saccharopolyspora erythraea (strain ATCC 11635 / DSM 40517 / JCM 4748 / NBRC 13426 / NCIMB 8594 / NRRL 2338) TaxID=405948 RepID=A4FH09_SACEN|nr:MFS transporter [Saccharopolyspora erythraea]EQD82570.1 major facilitator transporter [Saccharopolyspora erythraea D]QRK87245.1 MHS family MFS transporter [Saccharopolyspora erythraea]CAM03334.1 metabolite transporter, MFS superfamily [Saccharopolyspora erythraea NRRL 2338]